MLSTRRKNKSHVKLRFCRLLDCLLFHDLSCYTAIAIGPERLLYHFHERTSRLKYLHERFQQYSPPPPSARVSEMYP